MGSDFAIANVDEIPSPALIVYRDAVAANIRRIGDMLGGYARLRPHIKTHKMSRVARMEMDAGITKFKCATPREAALVAAVGARDVLLSYPVVGPQIERVVGLKKTVPDLRLSVIGDDDGAIRALSAACEEAGATIGVLIDLNTGMNRTGVLPGEPAVRLARLISSLGGLSFEGLHVYDGHVGNPDPGKRRAAAAQSIARAVDTRRAIEKAGIPIRLVVASGSQGFDVTADTGGVDEVSPGTWIFWDTGYGASLDYGFRWAVAVLSRVISTPGPDLITLDAGNKSLAPDTAPPYFRIANFNAEVEFLTRNEEHQVLRIPRGVVRPNVGDVFYLVPRHVCTTVNLWDEACIVDGKSNFVETWPVDARGH